MATRSSLRQLRLAIGVLGVAAVLLVAATAWLVLRPGGPLVGSQQATVEIGGPFELTAHTGRKMTGHELDGKPFAVFFGFTQCPEVCPTTLWEMSEAVTALGDKADGFKVLFVTVDPVRDTPELMASYLQSFNPNIVGLTGSEAEIADIANAYRAYWRKVPLEGGDYTMDHTASVYLMDAQGQFAGTIAYEEDAQTRLSKLENLLRR